MGVMLKADRLTGSLRPSNVSVLELIISPDIGQARAVASRTQLPIGQHYATTGTLRQNRSC